MGITAKTVIKSLIPNLKHSLKEKPKVFYQTESLHRHIWGKLIPQLPPSHLLPQTFQIEAEVIDSGNICLQRYQEVNSAKGV